MSEDGTSGRWSLRPLEVASSTELAELGPELWEGWCRLGTPGGMQEPQFSAQSLQDPGGRAGGCPEEGWTKLRQGKSRARSSEEEGSLPSHSVGLHLGIQEGAIGPLLDPKPPAQPEGPQGELEDAWAPQPELR